MIIDGFQKLTLLDYPGCVACIIFTKGCNLRCPFCHNSPLVLDKTKKGNIVEEKIFDYLSKRKGIIDGVVVSGGEPTIQKELINFIKKIKEIGYKVKLDTNGTNPKILKELIENKLIDYVAMDIKNTFDKYNVTVGKKTNIDNIKESISILKKSQILYEFRTTIVKEFHTISDIKEILKYIKGSTYYIQNFKDNENVIYEGLHGFSIDELNLINDELKEEFTNYKIRELE